MANTSVDFTKEAQQILDLAIKEARRLKHDYLAPEHILLALVADENTAMVKSLSSIGVTPHKVKVAVEFIVGHGDHDPKKVSLTPRGKKVIEIALSQARNANSPCQPEHLLFGILAQSENIGAEVLESIAELERLREYIKTIDSA